MTVIRNLTKSPYDIGGERLPPNGEVDVALPGNILAMLRNNPAFKVIDPQATDAVGTAVRKRGRPRKDDK